MTTQSTTQTENQSEQSRSNNQSADRQQERKHGSSKTGPGETSIGRDHETEGMEDLGGTGMDMDRSTDVETSRPTTRR